MYARTISSSPGRVGAMTRRGAIRYANQPLAKWIPDVSRGLTPRPFEYRRAGRRATLPRAESSRRSGPRGKGREERARMGDARYILKSRDFTVGYFGRESRIRAFLNPETVATIPPRRFSRYNFAARRANDATICCFYIRGIRHDNLEKFRICYLKV